MNDKGGAQVHGAVDDQVNDLRPRVAERLAWFDVRVGVDGAVDLSATLVVDRG